LTITLFVLAQCLAGIFRPSAIKKKKKFFVKETSDQKSKTPSGDQSTTNPEEQGFEVEFTNITKLTEEDEPSRDDDNSNKSDIDSWSLLTPPPPPPPPKVGEEAVPRSDSTIGEEEGEGEEVLHGTTNNKDITNEEEGEKNNSTDDKKKDEMIRTFWKYFHRSMGMILLGLAWYNCQSGIVLFSDKYNPDNEQHLLNVFWGITGFILVSFLLKGYILRD
jgi:hypothetical protein